MKRAIILGLAGWLLCGLVAAYGASRQAGSDVMIQTFGWNSAKNGVPAKWLELVGERAAELGQMGFRMAWIPPVSRSVSPQGYMPGDWYDFGKPDSPTFYGTRGDLLEMLKKLRQAGVLPIADIVINHRCAGQQDGSGIWNQFVFPSGKARWDQSAIVRGEFGGTGNSDTGDNFEPAPDIDHNNPQVRKDVAEFLVFLRNCGFGGWRYDFAKGYDPKFIAEYDRESSSQFSVAEIFTDMAYTNSVPEYDQNRHRQKLCDYLDKAGALCTVFDVTTKGILQEAVKGEYWRLRDKDGKASGLIGWWPERAVTFLDNHDTGSQQNLWPFPANKVMQGYAYILTHPGIPCVFWEHVYDWKLKEPIRKLMEIRRAFGLNSGSKLKIEKAEQGIYAAVVDDKVAVKLGWADWTPPAEYKLVTSGEQFAVWGKGGMPAEPSSRAHRR